MSKICEIGGICYELEDGAAKVVGTARKDIKELTVPCEIECDGVAFVVKSIQKGAFAGLDQLESISLPFIGSDDSAVRETLFVYIFGATQYARVIPGDRVYDTPDIHIPCNNYEYVPKSLKRVTAGGSMIGKQAFRGCRHIEEITLADTVETIDEDAFAGCTSLKKIDLPASVRVIGWTAFSGCDSLESIHIKEGVSRIGEKAFAECKNLKSISLPSTVQEIASDAFAGCEKLAYKRFCHCEYLGNAENPYLALVRLKDRGASVVSISHRTKIICDSAFEGCRDLCEIKIPRGVRAIGGDAFAYCKNLARVDLPTTLESIGSFAFQYCGSLEELWIPRSVRWIDTCAFRDCGSVLLEIDEETANATFERGFAYGNYHLSFGSRKPRGT